MPVAAYVEQMRERLEKMAELVKENARKAPLRQKWTYDRKAKPRSLNIGDQVLVLLPKPQNRLKLEWVGPYTVTRKLTSVDYEDETPGRQSEKKIYHVNLLKKWYPAQADVSTACLAILSTDSETEGEEKIPVTGVQREDDLYSTGEGSVVKLEDVVSNLKVQQQQQLQELMDKFPALFRETPGHTTLTEHEIHVGDAAPIRQKPYWVLYSQQDVVK